MERSSRSGTDTRRLTALLGRIAANRAWRSGLETLMMPDLAAALRTLHTCCVLLLARRLRHDGCERKAADPFETANRQVYAFNVGNYKATLKPVAKGYAAAVRSGCAKNQVSPTSSTNLDEPTTIVTAAAGQLKLAAQDTVRFALKHHARLGGLFDPASDANLQRHDEDLGQTLGCGACRRGPT